MNLWGELAQGRRRPEDGTGRYSGLASEETGVVIVCSECSVTVRGAVVFFVR
jgi:hypothetical protein